MEKRKTKTSNISFFLQIDTTDYSPRQNGQKNKPTVIDDNYELTSKEEDLIELFRQLSPEQQEIVLRAAGLDPREVDKG